MDHGQLLGNLSNHEMTDKSQNMIYMTNTVHACPIQYLEWRLCEMTGATFDAKSPERPHFRGIKAAFLAAVRMVRVHVLNMLPWYHLNTFEVRLVMHLKHCVFHMYAGCVVLLPLVEKGEPIPRIAPQLHEAGGFPRRTDGKVSKGVKAALCKTLEDAYMEAWNSSVWLTAASEQHSAYPTLRCVLSWVIDRFDL